jgi:hypothetical protein
MKRWANIHLAIIIYTKPIYENKEFINKKYNYYKDDIHSAEDFIKYSATQSTITKKKYTIHCVDLPIEYSRDWLLEELSRYRIKGL